MTMDSWEQGIKIRFLERQLAEKDQRIRKCAESIPQIIRQFEEEYAYQFPDIEAAIIKAIKALEQTE